MLPPDFADPLHERGWWLVATRSGSSHVIDSRAGLENAVITRARLGASDPVSLRRDGQALRLRAVWHVDASCERTDGIRVGHRMRYAVEPLGAPAVLTLRASTPVVAIRQLHHSTSEGTGG